MKRYLVSMLFAAGLLTISIQANATVWKIDTVGTGSSGFGASLFHDASGSSAMSGSKLDDITGVVSGTYNDVSGEFKDVVLQVGSGGSSFTFLLSNSTGPMIFNNSPAGGFGELLNASTLNIDFTGGSVAGVVSTTLGFSKGFVCCGANDDDPNSFHSEGPNGAVMTLWGADGFGTSTSGMFPYDDSPDLGMDLRLHLTAVPLPLSLPLLGSALFALGLLGRRNKKHSAVQARA